VLGADPLGRGANQDEEWPMDNLLSRKLLSPQS